MDLADRHVLFIDQDAESRRNTRFLLQLSHQQVTSFGYFDEALNWMTCLAHQTLRIDLVIVRNIRDFDAFLDFILLLESSSPGIRVLIIAAQQKGLSRMKERILRHLQLKITWCSQDEFHHRITSTAFDLKERTL